MARSLSDILRRFRPAVTPGPPAPAAVPSDLMAAAEAELAPVFAALEAATTAARQVRDEARGQAERRRRDATATAGDLLAQTRSSVDAVRADAAAKRLATLDEDRAQLQRSARAEARRVTRVGATRQGDLVEEVVAEVRATAGLPGADRPPGSGGTGDRTASR